jgi:hypothetical protein
MTTSTRADKLAGQESRIAEPPEEKTWKYYSRHHEMPASGVSSLAVHLAALGVLIVGGLVTAKVASNGRPAEIVAALGPDAGDKELGNSRSSGVARNRETPEEDVKPTAKAASVSVPALGTIMPVKSKAWIPEQGDAGRAIQVGSQKALKDLNQQVGAALQEAGEPLHRVGDQVRKDGPPGNSDDNTVGTTIQRGRRWQLNFQVTGAMDHLRQFAALGAILAVPEPEGGFRVFKDLNAWPGLRATSAANNRHPVSEHMDTLADIHRIGFADRETVAEVASVLGMPEAPYLLAFFPKELEEKMARLERQFQHGLEENIHSKTYFQVVPRGPGYDVVIDRSRTVAP